MLLYCVVCYIVMPLLIVHNGRKQGRTEYSETEIKEIAVAPYLITLMIVVMVVSNVIWLMKRKGLWR